jgi:hypothetical protein
MVHNITNINTISQANGYRINGALNRSVGIETGYGPDGRVSIPDRVQRLFSTPQRPDCLWGPLSLISNVYGGLFSRGEAGGA